SNDRALGRKLEPDRAWTRGVIALAAGQSAQGLAELRRAANEHRCEMCPLPAFAPAQEATGDVRGAVASYEDYLTTPWDWRYEADGVELSRVLRRLASLRAANGDSVGAADARARLATLWAKADPVLRGTRVDR